MGMLDGKVALITGGSRGQGRAHAVTSAREGADVIMVDIADQMASVPYTMATSEDLDETVKQVEAFDRRALAHNGRRTQPAAARRRCRARNRPVGQIDILIANAGIWTGGPVLGAHR